MATIRIEQATPAGPPTPEHYYTSLSVDINKKTGQAAIGIKVTQFQKTRTREQWIVVEIKRNKSGKKIISCDTRLEIEDKNFQTWKKRP